MTSVGFGEAAVEVLDILEHTQESDVKKIPENFIKFLKENSSKTYNVEFDYSKPISEMNLKPKTEALLGIIYLKYWADEKGKKEFQEKLDKNEEIYIKQAEEQYNSDNLFENNKSKEIDNTNLPQVVKKESFIKKIINKLKSIFKF